MKKQLQNDFLQKFLMEKFGNGSIQNWNYTGDGIEYDIQEAINSYIRSSQMYFTHSNQNSFEKSYTFYEKLVHKYFTSTNNIACVLYQQKLN